MAKKTRFAFRTTDEFKQRIARVAEKLGLDQAVIGEAALEAVVAYVEKYGEITIPIQIERRTERALPPKHLALPPKHVHGRRLLPAHSPLTAHPEGTPVQTTRVTGLNEPEGQYRAHRKKKGERP